MNKFALGQVRYRVPQFSCITIIPPVLQTLSSTPYAVLTQQLTASLNNTEKIKFITYGVVLIKVNVTPLSA